MSNFPFVFLLIATLLFLSGNSSATATTDDTATDGTSPAPSPTLSTYGCDAKCENRCALAGYKERCLKYCGICCDKCEGCVPSSPKADKAECPCYRDLKNSKGKSKCP